MNAPENRDTQRQAQPPGPTEDELYLAIIAKFDSLNRQLGEIGTRLARLEERQGAEDRLCALVERALAMLTKAQQAEAKLADHERRLATLEAKLTAA